MTTMVGDERVFAPTEQKDLCDRLARIEGHVRAIRRMVEEDRPCEDLLLQISAVRAALRSLTGRILDYHLDECIAGITDDAVRAAALANLRGIIKRAGLIEGS